MLEKLQAVVSESGIWSDARRESHAFLLSPSVYKISGSQRAGLEQLGYALYDCLLGLSHIAVIAYDIHLNYGGAWQLARRVFASGVPKVHGELQGSNIRHLPQLLKIDLLVDQAGNFRIAEIDGHNKHGLGYSTLARRFREQICPAAAALPGAVRTLAAAMEKQGHRELKLFYADQDRFYRPEFEIAAQEFLKYGIDCQVVAESSVQQSWLETGLFLDLPFLHDRTPLYESIVPAYRSGRVSFIIPPKPFFGAKSVLALLRNDGGNEQLEAILRSFIRASSLDLVRRHIPETLFVGRQGVGADTVSQKIAGRKYVLKESISSGMKGTVFSDSPDFAAALRQALRSQLNWILQEEVANQPQTFSWFQNGSGREPELQTADGWFMRVTAQYVNRQLADIVVTARRDKSVHGAKDCLQLGTVIA